MLAGAAVEVERAFDGRDAGSVGAGMSPELEEMSLGRDKMSPPPATGQRSYSADVRSSRFCAAIIWALKAGATFFTSAFTSSFFSDGRSVVLIASMTALWNATSCWRKVRSNALPCADSRDFRAAA